MQTAGTELNRSYGKCSVLHLRKSNFMCSLEPDLLGKRSAEKDLRGLVYNRMTMSQQCTLMVKKANGRLRSIKNNVARKEAVLLLDSALLCTGVLLSILGSQVKEGQGTTEGNPVERH